MDLAARVVAYFRAHGRDLPFRRTRDPYAIWICEIMAQQTRIATVIPYWQRWMDRFPTPAALADAPLDDVLAHWAGLGYYARARAIHRAARAIVDRHGGALPDDVEALAALPGIGPYTAGAIASIAFGQRVPVVDGNVARIFARVHGIEDDVRSPATRRRMWSLAAELVPPEAPGEFNQGLMDLGATICTPRAPRCDVCPLAGACVARRRGLAETLPIVKRRGATARVEVRAAWIVRGDRWLLARRAPSGLFGGLWELPQVDSLRAAIRVEARPSAEHTHKLSHRTIRYRVYRARLDAGARITVGAPYDGARFFAPAALASLGVSSATAALAARLLEQIAWPTPNARSRSSTKGTRRSFKA